MKAGIPIDIFRAALEGVDPDRAVRKSFSVAGDRMRMGDAFYDLRDFDRIWVVGAGKATAPMASAIEDLLGDRIDSGVIIVKVGHTRPLRRIRQVEAGHPIPDEAGVRGTEEILGLLKGADERTLVLCLLSGGGSALLVSPAEGISLDDKREATDLLLRAGADIHELNTVRKHLSAVKGGRLAETIFPATLLTLALSDVPGDRLDMIASGPTVPDPTLFAEAESILRRYALESRLPRVIDHIRRGVRGEFPETPKPGSELFERSRTVVIGSLGIALDAAEARAKSMEFDVERSKTELLGEARECALQLAGRAKGIRRTLTGQDRPRCLLSGGETTVTVKGSGLGGRNQELALAFALAIEGIDGITLLSCASDGTDGPTDAAGAVVDGKTISIARSLGLDPERFLEENDSYSFFKRVDLGSGCHYHIVMGPTGTNVMDIQVLLVEASP